MEKIERIINHPDFKLYLSRNRYQETGRVFCSHGFDHLLTVARLTYLLVLERGDTKAVKEIAYAAGLLHDIGRWQEYTGDIDHARAGAELAHPLLVEAGFKSSEIEPILNAIREHRRESPPGKRRHPLSQALYEADLFSRLCFNCPVTEKCRKYPAMPQGNRLCY